MSKTELLDNHIKSLGFRNIRDYQSWCLTAGFSTSLRKSARKLEEEQQHVTDQRQRNLLKSHKILPFKTIIDEIRTDTVSHRSSVQIEITENFNRFKKHRQFQLSELYLEVLLYLNNCSKLTQNDEMVQSVAYLVSHHDKWLQPYNTWKSKTHNIYKQLSSFAGHLLAKYKVPAFMYAAWEAPKQGKTTLEKELCQEWFCHLWVGKNIRTAKNLPCPLSKKEAHHFLKAPNDYTITEAIRWGQIFSLEGNLRLMHSLRETKLMGSFSSNNFCLQVIRFFINHPMLDLVHVNPIIDYIWNQKFECRRVFVGRGAVEMQDPPQSNFSMTGRTAESLLNQVERWHRQLGKESKNRKNLQWEHHPIKDFIWKQGKAEKGTLKIWRIINLVTSQELLAEGRAMKHCVASYAHSCARGASSIWSLTLDGKKHITIELRDGRVGQLRGKGNRVPDTKEMNIIKRWAQKEEITIASYLEY